MRSYADWPRFGGLTNAEVAETVGLTERSIERQWAFARVWLLRAMSAGSDPA